MGWTITLRPDMMCFSWGGVAGRKGEGSRGAWYRPLAADGVVVARAGVGR
jgi:hypothetical protein